MKINLKIFLNIGVVIVVTVVTVVFKGFFRIFLPHFTTFTTLQITTKRVHGLYFFKFDLIVKIPYISFPIIKFNDVLWTLSHHQIEMILKIKKNMKLL